MKRKLRMGMVGGGPGAFIGAVHRTAARLDGKIELVCGAFSSSAEKSKAAGRELFLPDERVYGSFQEMIEAEASLPAGERMDFVSIVTPNHMHLPVALAALERGFHVICDKPMTLNLEDAVTLRDKVNEAGLVFCLTHNYTGYPMVKQAREMVQAGQLGEIRKIVSEYPQGWLARRIEDDNHKQAAWRTDPKISGVSCCMGDIGSHAENLAAYITGLKITELCADLNTFVPGRRLDDDGSVLVRFDNGARGIIYASQISAGDDNGLRIRVYGTKGAIEWLQKDPNNLIFKSNDAPVRIYNTGWAGAGAAAAYNTRIPAGHPEGFLEAFANLYRNFAAVVAARIDGVEPAPAACDFPTVEDGVRGMAFIETVVKSAASKEKWVKFPQI
ncbi:Gfo/Idh/MocA family oxidoreductase [Lentisphaerota bacterium ZTH]|nr:Gfo/Idh/MocA family oxidoreductase [Lentisphaerota bacterium]WET05380.1 Gfo/Idh/MocA family oxidoreductase [Lentisphaerota bacterium ZTH]